jgi:hypothetical protein
MFMIPLADAQTYFLRLGVNAGRLLPHRSLTTFFRSPLLLHGGGLSSFSPIPFLHLVIFFISRAFYGGICVHRLLGRYTPPPPANS